MLFLILFSIMTAETTNPAFLAFLLENFVEDIVNLPINMSKTEIRSAKVAELYQRVQVLNEYITMKTGIPMDGTSTNEHEHEHAQQSSTAENDGDKDHRLSHAKMHQLSEWADDARVKTICGIGYMGQVDQGQFGLLTALTMFLLSNPTARLIVFMVDVFEQYPTATITDPISNTPTPQTINTPSTASLQHANAAVQVTLLSSPCIPPPSPCLTPVSVVQGLLAMFPQREIVIIANDLTLSVGNVAKLLTSSGSLCNLVYLDNTVDVETAYEGDMPLQRYLGGIVDPVYHRVVVERHNRCDFDVVNYGSDGSGSDGDGGTSSSSSSSSSSASSTSMLSMLAALPHVHARALSRLGDPPAPYPHVLTHPLSNLARALSRLGDPPAPYPHVLTHPLSNLARALSRLGDPPAPYLSTNP